MDWIDLAEYYDQEHILINTAKKKNVQFQTFIKTFFYIIHEGRGVDHPLPSSAEVKERVELYVYSPSGP